MSEPEHEPDVMSRSYPYLWISRKFLLDYGTVLCYSDAIEKNPSAWNCWERAAAELCDALPPAVSAALDAYMYAARRLWLIARSRGMQAALTEDYLA